MIYWDEEGNIREVRQKSRFSEARSAQKDKSEKKRRDKVKEPKFKKGSWKDRLFKKLKKWRSSPFVEKFHFIKAANLLIQPSGDRNSKSGKFVRFTQKVKIGKGSNEYLLINTYDEIYTRISSKAYRELCKIDRISLSFTLQGEDDDGEVFDVYDKELIIDNINDLMSFINFHRQGITGVYEIMMASSGFFYYNYRFKVVVRKTDGTVDTYKSDINDFMKEYDLRPF